MPGCPSDTQIEQLHAGTLDAVQAEDVRRHSHECTSCRVRVERILAQHERMIRDIKAAHADAWISDGSGNAAMGESGDAGAADSRGPAGAAPTRTAAAPDSGAAGVFPPVQGYQILGQAGRGGQGVIYKAVQQSTKRVVALKLLLHGLYATPRERQRFQREVDLVASLRHPHIVTIYDSGTTGDGRLFYAMEYVSGVPLDRWVTSQKLALPDVLRLYGKVCTAVACAHRRGVIHRDLKPGNIRIDAAGEPHVLDFGLAKAAGSSAGSDGAPMTQTGEFMGTLAYAAPEQLRGDPGLIDLRTDVYALGVILYELLTGSLPYEVGSDVGRAVENIARSEPKRPSAIRRQVNREVETIVLKALSKEKERRYRSAEELAEDVERYLTGRPISARRDSAWYVMRKAVARRRWGLVVATLVISAGGLAWYWRISATQSRVVASRAEHEAAIERARRAFADASVEEFSDPAGAVRGYDEAISMQPDFLEAKVRRAFLLRRLNRLDEAFGSAQMILVQHPTAGAAYFLLAEICRSRDQPLEAEQYLEAGRRLAPGDLYYQAAALDSRHARDAIALLTRLISQKAVDPDARLARAWRFLEAGEYNAGLVDVDFLIESRMHLGAAWNLRGLILSRLDRFDEALETYAKAITATNGSASVHVNRAETLIVTQDLLRAINDCNLAIKKNPRSAAAHSVRARAYWYMGKLDYTQRDCDRAIALDPQNTLARLLWGKVLRKEKRFDEALVQLQLAMPGGSATRAEALCEMGDVLRERREYARAIEKYSASLELDSRGSDALLGRALARQGLRDYEKAAEDAGAAIRLDPNSPQAWSCRATLYRNVGNLKAALADYGHAIRLAPDEPRLHAARAVAYWLAGDSDRALKSLERAFAIGQAPGGMLHLFAWQILSLRGRPGDKERAAQELQLAAGGETTAWEKKLIDCCSGKLPWEKLVAMASDASERCTAAYYAGVRMQIDGKHKEANELFRACLETKAEDEDEYFLAKHRFQTALLLPPPGSDPSNGGH